MSTRLNRRRFLAVSAAAGFFPAAGHALAAPLARWRGFALGAPAAMTLVGLDGAEAEDVFAAVQREIHRQEMTFSLYRNGSALARLNANGRLAAPPEDLREVLRLAGRLHRTSGGAFDPTIQPLWLLRAQSAAAKREPAPQELARARRLGGWHNVDIGEDGIAFARPGMALTLNGIAQGYIADRVADLLRQRGLSDVLVDMGEIQALGRRADGGPWRAALARPDGAVVRQITLSDRALATSAPKGTLLDAAGRVGHILDPRSGEPAEGWEVVSVSAPSAALADGLSTAFCLMSRDAIEGALRHHPEAKLETLV